MKCGCFYCIYNHKLRCILKSIQIDTNGMCEECIFVSIPEKELEQMKERDLEGLSPRG